MNSKNIFVVDHQQINGGYRGSAGIQANVSQLKPTSTSNAASSLINGVDKVIFKVESDNLTNTTNNFKSNNNFTNQSNNSIINNNNIICNSNNNNNNNIDIKQIKINQNFNNNYNININNNNQHINTTTSPALNLGNNDKKHSIKIEPVEQPAATEVSASKPSTNLPEIGTDTNDIPGVHVNNVVCSYSTRCHLNLRKIAMEGMHVEYKKENGVSFQLFVSLSYS